MLLSLKLLRARKKKKIFTFFLTAHKSAFEIHYYFPVKSVSFHFYTVSGLLKNIKN